MTDTIIIIGLILTLAITLPVLIIFAVILHSNRDFIRAMQAQVQTEKVNYDKRRVKRGDNGCQHASNKDMEVTAMGDDARYFICTKCHEKVREDDLEWLN